MEFKSNSFRSLSSLVNRNTLKAPTTSFLDYLFDIFHDTMPSKLKTEMRTRYITRSETVHYIFSDSTVTRPLLIQKHWYKRRQLCKHNYGFHTSSWFSTDTLCNIWLSTKKLIIFLSVILTEVVAVVDILQIKKYVMLRLLALLLWVTGKHFRII